MEYNVDEGKLASFANSEHSEREKYGARGSP